MPPTDRLTDARDTTADQAEQLLRDIFDAHLAIQRREAAAEAQISELREQVRLDTLASRILLELREAQLSAHILANRDYFQRPRMRACKWGRYGLRSSTRIEIADPEAVLKFARDHGYDDLYRVQETIIKPAVTKRLQAGQTIPGADLCPGEASEYKLDTALLEQQL